MLLFQCKKCTMDCWDGKVGLSCLLFIQLCFQLPYPLHKPVNQLARRRAGHGLKKAASAQAPKEKHGTLSAKQGASSRQVRELLLAVAPAAGLISSQRSSERESNQSRSG